MNRQELLRLAAERESERLEFKPIIDLHCNEANTRLFTTVAKIVCAMLNGLGGTVIFGVGNKGELVGHSISQRAIEEMNRQLSRIEPSAFPAVEIITVMDKRNFTVLKVRGSSGLYNYDGCYYMRVGPTTQRMPHHELERRLINIHATTRREKQPVPDDVSIANMDPEELRLAIRKTVASGLLPVPKNGDVESILRGLDLVHNGNKYIFKKDGAGWLLAFGGPPDGNWLHLTGLQRIHQLLQNPGKAISVIELAQSGLNGADLQKNEQIARELDEQQDPKGLAAHATPTGVNIKKLKVNRQKIVSSMTELQAHIDNCDDPEKREDLDLGMQELMERRDKIDDTLETPYVKNAKRAYNAVRKSIVKESLPEIEKRIPEMAKHLIGSIKFKAYKCTYTPTDMLKWLL